MDPGLAHDRNLLEKIRIVTFLAKLNGLEVTGGDMGNAYLKAYTKEKVCSCAGPERSPLAGTLLFRLTNFQ